LIYKKNILKIHQEFLEPTKGTTTAILLTLCSIISRIVEFVKPYLLPIASPGRPFLDTIISKGIVDALNGNH
jgi:hypothetical protein